jgi:phosphoglycolate phosphatase
MKKIKLVVFDLDGTLVDAYPAIIESFNYTMRKVKMPTRDNITIRRAVGWGDKKLLAPFVYPKDLKKALETYRRHHVKALIRKSRLLPGAKEVLSYLRNKGYRLCVASNRPTKFSLLLISHLKIKRFFDYVLCADKLRYAKPHPEILNKIRRKFRLKPRDMLYIGDMTIDAITASRAKIKTILLTTGSHKRSELQKEKHYRIINKLSDLRKIL